MRRFQGKLSDCPKTQGPDVTAFCLRCYFVPVETGTKEPSSDGLAMASFGFLCTSLWVTGKVTMIGDPLSVSDRWLEENFGANNAA